MRRHRADGGGRLDDDRVSIGLEGLQLRRRHQHAGVGFLRASGVSQQRPTSNGNNNRNQSTHRLSFTFGRGPASNNSIGQAHRADHPPPASRLPIKFGLRALHAEPGQGILTEFEDSGQ